MNLSTTRPISYLKFLQNNLNQLTNELIWQHSQNNSEGDLASDTFVRSGIYQMQTPAW